MFQKPMSLFKSSSAQDHVSSQKCKACWQRKIAVVRLLSLIMQFRPEILFWICLRYLKTLQIPLTAYSLEAATHVSQVVKQNVWAFLNLLKNTTSCRVTEINFISRLSLNSLHWSMWRVHPSSVLKVLSFGRSVVKRSWREVRCWSLRLFALQRHSESF